MSLLYKPFAIIASLIASRIGRSVFRSLWSRIDDQPPPDPGSGEGSLVKVVGAKTLEATVMAAAAATVSRLFAGLFHHLFGVWPKKPAEAEED
jgi:hypothetical protein